MIPTLPSLFPSIHEKALLKLIIDLQKPAMPYNMPWRGAIQSPWNMVTRRRYAGTNAKTLAQVQRDFGYRTCKWGTRRQIEQLGGWVRDGELGTVIYFGTRRRGPGNRTRGIYRQYTVFNFEQCEGLPDNPAPPMPSETSLARFQTLAACVATPIKYGGHLAYYDPATDVIQLPDRGAFYYPLNDLPRTWLHETAHAAMSPLRLNIVPPGDHALARYAWHEIIAEMAAAFVLSHLGIKASVRSSDYIADWYGCTKSNKVLEPLHLAVQSVAEDAMRVADHILAYAP